MKKQTVCIVMPAYNAERTLEETYHALPKGSYDSVIVVDDASTDKTQDVVRKLHLPLVVHKKNLGYGGNQKTCYLEALRTKADIVVMLHPDYQYDPKLVPLLTAPLKNGYFDIMLGSRIRSRKEALAGGMPMYKYFFNRVLTLLENIVLGLNLSEYHTGYRAYTREVLGHIAFEKMSNDFVFDQQFLIEAHKKGFRIGEIAVPVRYFKEASSINFFRSTTYGIATLIELLRFMLNH